MAAPIRTRFEPGGMRRSAIWRGLLVALGGVVLGVVLWIAGSVAAGVGLIAIGLIAGAITGYGLLTSLRPVTLVLGEAGIDVTVSGRPFSLAWSDVEAWSLGDWVLGRLRATVNPALVVWPAAHVDDAGAGNDRPLWVSGGRCWRLGRTRYLDGTAEELEAAMTHFAGDKQRPVGG